MSLVAACFRGLISLTILFACAGKPAKAVGEPASPPEAVKFSLDGKFDAAAAPFVVALDKGFFKAEGLNVELDGASTVTEAISRVASGAYQMGFADINALIRFRDENPKSRAIAVFMVYNKPPFAVIGRKSRGVCKPADLEGRKLGVSQQDSAFAYWRIFAEAAGVEAEKVAVENVGTPIREPMLAAGEVDAIVGPSFSSYANLKDRGVPADDICVLLMADYGVKLYGHAVIANPKFAAEKPESLRAFLRAVARGMRETSKNPGAAIAAVLKRNDAISRDVELEKLQMALRDNITTPETKANGLGAVDMSRLEKAIEQIAPVYAFKGPKPRAEDIFDPSFLPDRAWRRKTGVD